MISCKSPVKVMRAAHALAGRLFDEHAHKFSRKDFTLPQLFACLVLREHLKKSYRGVEALLADCSDLRAAVGLARAPDHNTLWRAFEHLVKPSGMDRALDGDGQAASAGPASTWPATPSSRRRWTRPASSPRHVSGHFERRQRQSGRPRPRPPKAAARPKKAGETGRRPPAVADAEAAAQAVPGRRHLVPPALLRFRQRPISRPFLQLRRLEFARPRLAKRDAIYRDPRCWLDPPLQPASKP